MIIFVSYSPMLGLLIDHSKHMGGVHFWPKPEFADLWSFWNFLTSGNTKYSQYVGFIALLIYVLGLIKLVRKSWKNWLRDRSLRSIVTKELAVFFWAFAPVIAIFIASQGSNSYFGNRYLLIVLPGVVLFLAKAMTIGRSLGINSFIALGLASALTFSTVYVEKYYSVSRKTNYKDTVEWILIHYPDSQVITLVGGVFGVSYYFRMFGSSKRVVTEYSLGNGKESRIFFLSQILAQEKESILVANPSMKKRYQNELDEQKTFRFKELASFHRLSVEKIEAPSADSKNL